jgi:hypothetical protein
MMMQSTIRTSLIRLAPALVWPMQRIQKRNGALAKLGLAAALSIAWVRALGEFGALMVTAYYPSGMPVQIWVNLQDAGMPAVMRLLVIFR